MRVQAAVFLVEVVVMMVVMTGVVGLPAVLPDNLGPSEEAPYTVIGEAETYEMRDYGSPKWVCSHMVQKKGSMNKKEKKAKMMKMFLGLFDYVNGGNSRDLHMNMTAPMTVKMEETEVTKMMQMCFYLPSALQSDPPAPQDPDVYVEERSNLKVVVRSFGGWAMKMKQWDTEKQALIADLKEAGEVNIDFTNCYGAVYDPPMKMENRRNEVWLKMD